MVNEHIMAIITNTSMLSFTSFIFYGHEKEDIHYQHKGSMQVPNEKLYIFAGMMAYHTWKNKLEQWTKKIQHKTACHPSTGIAANPSIIKITWSAQIYTAKYHNYNGF